MEENPFEKLFALHSRVAIVTGAAGAIGRIIATRFVQAGASVAFADRDEDGAALAARQAGSERAVTFGYDQSDPASIEALVAAVTERFGRLDIMVNCAAAFGIESFATMSPESWDRVHSVNLRGVAFCCQSAMRAMVAGGKGGSIVNISSIAGSRFVLFDNVAYAVSKSGNNGLTQNLAREFAEHAIRVNAVIPGAIRNEGLDASAMAMALRGPMTQPDFIPLGGFGEADDIAAACLYLASDAARYVTGQLIAVDGGISIA